MIGYRSALIPRKFPCPKKFLFTRLNVVPLAGFSKKKKKHWERSILVTLSIYALFKLNIKFTFYLSTRFSAHEQRFLSKFNYLDFISVKY